MGNKSSSAEQFESLVSGLIRAVRPQSQRLEMNCMVKLFSALIYAYYWSDCLKAYDNCDYEKALQQLSKADFVAKNRKAQFHIMKAQLQYVLGNEEKSCAEIKTSIDLLDRNTTMPSHDKEYLKEYCRFLIEKMDINCSAIPLDRDFEFDHVKTEHVSKRFTDVFPIKRQ